MSNWKGFIDAAFEESTRATAAPADKFFAWWTSIETDLRKSLILGARTNTEKLHDLLRTTYEAGQNSQPSPSTGGEQILCDALIAARATMGHPDNIAAVDRALETYKIIVGEPATGSVGCDVCGCTEASCNGCAKTIAIGGTGGEPATDSAGLWHAPGLGEVHSHDHKYMIDCQREIDHPDQDYVADDDLAKKVCAALNAAREPAPVARELDVEAERRAFEALAQQRGLNVTRSASNPERYRFDRTGVAWEFWLIASRAARQATAESAPASAAPGDQWQIVPRVMTFDMHVAFAEVWFSKVRPIDDHDMQDAYAALLDAAPSNNSPVGAKESK